MSLQGALNPFYYFLRWDSIHYLEIALGESQASVFFPLYPLLIWIFSMFFSPVSSGFIISFFSLAIALYYLDRLIKRDFNKKISHHSLLLLLFFPSAIFLPLIYTEALFLAILTSFFYYLGEKKWLIAIILAFFATITRNVGIFLWPIFLISFYLQLNVHPLGYVKKNLNILLRKKYFWLSFFIPLGLILYCFYNYLILGDFFAFINYQKNWSDTHVFKWPWQTIKEMFNIIFHLGVNKIGTFNYFRIIFVEFGSFILLFISSIYWLIKKHWPYTLFCLLNLITFSTIFPMVSVNRYVVVIFPIFIFLAQISKKQDWLFYFMLSVSYIFFFFNIFIFSSGGWVA